MVAAAAFWLDATGRRLSARPLIHMACVTFIITIATATDVVHGIMIFSCVQQFLFAWDVVQGLEASCLHILPRQPTGLAHFHDESSIGQTSSCGNDVAIGALALIALSY